MVRMEDIWFKPVEGHTREERDSIVDFSGLYTESIGPVIKVQLEGNNECLQFLWVQAIKNIRFLDFGMDWPWRRVVNLIAETMEEVYKFEHEAGVIIARVSGITTRSSRSAWSSRATGIRWATRRAVRALQLAMVAITGRVRFIIRTVIAIAIVPFIDREKALSLGSHSPRRVIIILAPAIGNSLVGSKQVQSHGVQLTSSKTAVGVGFPMGMLVRSRVCAKEVGIFFGCGGRNVVYGET